MKRTIQKLLLGGVLLISADVLAQQNEVTRAEVSKSEKTPNTYFDIMINAVGTNLNYGDANDGLKDYKKEARGIQAGVSFQAGITPSFSLVSELYFMMKGGKLKAENPLTINETTQRLYGIELPVLARVHFGKFHLNAGPSASYNLSGTRKVNGETTDIAFSKVNNDFRRFEAGAQAGGGYTFRINKKRVALDLRYNYGLTNLSRTQEVYNRSFIVSVHTSPRWKRNPF